MAARLSLNARAFLLTLFVVCASAVADEPPAPPYLSPQEAAPTPPQPLQQRGATLPLKPERKISFDTDEGTWMSIDLSPDGRTLVFDLLGDLYELAATGGDARRITSGLPFDSQPTFSPDGSQLAFLSDRSGAENIWIAKADGTEPRQLSLHDEYDMFVSPAWSADGKAIYVSRHRADLNVYELWKFALDGDGAGELVMPARASADAPEASWRSVLGVTPSRDGRYLYYAAHTGNVDSHDLPEWTIGRRDLQAQSDETLVSAPKSPRPDLSIGSAFRPAISPDGRTLVYGSHHDGTTGLRVLDLATQADRWLAFPVQHDQLQAFASQDHLPRYTFAPDGRALILDHEGKIQRLDLASGKFEPIPFRAHVDLDIGPFLRVNVKQETGPVRARLIQSPVQSPDGKRIAFSALGHVYVMDLKRGAAPRRLTQGAAPEFQPSWSPDGQSIVYVTWTARDAGQIWSAAAKGHGEPRQLTDVAAFYTFPTFTPDGASIVAQRSSNAVRMHSYMEYGSLRNAELIRVPAAGGASQVIIKSMLGGRPQFTQEAGRVTFNCAEGLNSIGLDGSGQRHVMQVVGPGWYFSEGPAPADDLKISPDGKWALAQIAQQLHLVAVPSAESAPINLSVPAGTHRKITDVGADFFEWADGGRTITWAVGSTFYRRSLESVAPSPQPAESFEVRVEVPRDTPRGALVLRGARALTMRGDEFIDDADILVVDDHIAAIGERGTVKVPADATVRNVAGKFIVPGFIDVHDHLADVRRGVLDLETWGPLANLAYGVTTAFDPSPLSIDMLAYEDLIDSGQMIGSRIHSTGPALFSFNDFHSKAEVDQVLSRYPDHYRTHNLKEYRTGNRRVRQWVAEVARERGIMPTTEGALSLKLDLTQIMDGYSGNEHALVAVPLYKDVIELVARTRVSYTPTLQITNGGPEGQDYFIDKYQPHDDVKLNRFSPHFVIDIKTLKREWRDPREYLFGRIAESAASIVRAGGLLGVGSHGEMPGIGVHWELQAFAMGGLTPLESLHAVTLGSAETIGRQAEFGSLEPGKYADLIVLERDPLEDIANTLSIEQVMKNGRLYDANTLAELWPRQRPLPRLWFEDDVPPATSDAPR